MIIGEGLGDHTAASRLQVFPFSRSREKVPDRADEGIKIVVCSCRVGKAKRAHRLVDLVPCQHGGHVTTFLCPPYGSTAL